ncbi:hypothetical protein CH368_06025 [Leptospira levettii]|nr:hypothetical protein CH368_06025 [Leptospira levettii]
MRNEVTEDIYEWVFYFFVLFAGTICFFCFLYISSFIIKSLKCKNKGEQVGMRTEYSGGHCLAKIRDSHYSPGEQFESGK